MLVICITLKFNRAANHCLEDVEPVLIGKAIGSTANGSKSTPANGYSHYPLEGRVASQPIGADASLKPSAPALKRIRIRDFTGGKSPSRVAERQAAKYSSVEDVHGLSLQGTTKICGHWTDGRPAMRAGASAVSPLPCKRQQCLPVSTKPRARKAVFGAPHEWDSSRDSPGKETLGLRRGWTNPSSPAWLLC